MKISLKIFILLLIPGLCILNCKKNSSGTNRSCISGKDISSINNDSIAQSLKDRIFKPVSPAKPDWNYISTTNPNYNSNGRTLIIPVEFPSIPRNPDVTPSVIRDAFFSGAGFGNDNVRAYFENISFGKFTLTEATIAPWVTLTIDTASYADSMFGRDWTRNPVLAKDICENVNINWPDMDLNHDHIITPNELQIVFLYADGGLGATRPSHFQINSNSGSFHIYNSFLYASCKSNTDPTKATEPIAYNYITIRHELMHAFFGLPDRYLTSAAYGMTGNYDPMSAMRPRWTCMNIIDKIKIGWMTPKILTYDGNIDPLYPHAHQCYAFPNSESTLSALVLYNATYPDECWIIENRCRDCASVSNFDTGLPESGLAIWWMDLNTERVFLVDASLPPSKPDLYTFQKGGALFSLRKDGKSDEFIPLYPHDGFAAFNFRMVSAAGTTMYAEF